jgi:recombination protein RecA
MVAQPRNAEQAFWIMETCVIGSVDLIVVDSANGLVRKAELDGDPDYVPHPQREYKDELNNLKDACRANGAIVIFLSKPRENDRQPVRGTGISEKAKDRVRLKIVNRHQDESRLIEAWVHGKEDSAALFSMNPGTGIDWAGETASLALKFGLAERDGSWINYEDETFHGFARFRELIYKDMALAVDLDDHIRRLTGIV